MNNHVKLEYENPVTDIRKFKENLFLLDSKMVLHKVTNSLKNIKDYSLFPDSEQYKHGAILHNGSILYEHEEIIKSFSVKSKKTIEYYWNEKEIASISQSFDGRFIAVGYKRGNVTIYLINGTVYQTVYFKYGNVLNIIFSNDSNKLVINYEKNKIVVHDVEYNVTLGTILVKAPFIHSAFLDDKRIFGVSESGYTTIVDIHEEEVISSNNNEIKGATSISVTPDKEYGLIGQYDGTLTVIFIERNKILFSKKLSRAEIIGIKWMGETLVISYLSGTVEFFLLRNDHESIKEHIEQRDFKSVGKIMKENSFLSLFSDIEKELDQAWNKDIFPKALDLILDENQEEAKKLVSPFTHDVYKNRVFNIYIDKPEVPDKFQSSYEKKEYRVLYELAKQYPHLKKTSIFQEVEKEWDIAYSKAFRNMKKNLKDKAIAILKLFYDVESKKHLISTLINIPNMFISSANTYKNGSLDEYFATVSRSQVLKDTPEYKEISKKMDLVLQELNNARKQDDVKKTIEIAKKLSLYRPHRKRSKEILESLKDKITFMSYVNKNETRLAYRLVDKNHDITEMEEFKDLYKNYLEKEKMAYKYIVSGHTKQIIVTLDKFVNIPFLKRKIASLVKTSLLNSLKDVKDPEMLDWKATIENYGRLFGLDHDMERMTVSIDRDKEYYKALGGRNPTGYMNKEFPNTILQYKTNKQLKEEALKEEESKRGNVKPYVHIIMTLLIILLVILGANFLTDYFQTAIMQYNQERKAGPYQFFNRAHEEFKKQGGSEDQESEKQQSFFEKTFGGREKP